MAHRQLYKLNSISISTFLYRPGGSEDLRVVSLWRSDLVDELALLLLGTDWVEDPLAVLALGDVELAGRLAVSGENL